MRELFKKIRKYWFYSILLSGIIAFGWRLTTSYALFSLKKRQSFLAISLIFLLTTSHLLGNLYLFSISMISPTLHTPTIKSIHITQQYRASYSDIPLLLSTQLQILKEQPTHHDALFNTALLYEYLGRSREAQAYYRQAIDADPNFQ